MKNVDLIVIGAGIHGAGVAQAAAAAGYSVLVVEKSAVGSGTSSKSSKLIHGGLRYLENFEFKLVRESLHERELLVKLAPDLVKRQTFYIPVYPDTSRRPLHLHAGLGLYAVLAGMKKEVRYHTVPKKEWGNFDGLTTHNLQHLFAYPDAQTDDQQLTRAVMRSAQELGAELVCPAKFMRASVSSSGCEVTFQIDGRQISYSCTAIVNAAGPWAREVAMKFSPEMKEFPVENVQGAHVEVLGRISKGCYYLEAPQDRRAVFVTPWKGHTLIGTTESRFCQLPDSVQPLESEIEYLTEVFKHYFPERELQLLNKWAGLRVLPAARGEAFKRSRETQLPVDNESSPRVVSIYGGKLTGYRLTALKVMKRLEQTLPERNPLADTATLQLTSPANR